MTNVDNINADQIPYLIDQLMEKGSGNVHVVTAITKKGRQEYIFLIDVQQDKVSLITNFLAGEIGTLGIRILRAEHVPFNYSMNVLRVFLKDAGGNSVWEGAVGIKIVKDGSGAPISARAEYEDLKSAAKAFDKAGSGITFYELKQMVENEALKHFIKTEFKVEFDPVCRENDKDGD